MLTTWGGRRDDNIFLQDDFRGNLFDSEEEDLIMLTFPPLLPSFPRQLFVLS